MLSLLLAIIYMAFISLGLPDALLGAAWPVMHQELGVNVSLAGMVFMVISGGTIVSSLCSDWLTGRFGAGRVTVFSVALTALALFGFSVSREYWMLLLFAVPYGLGAGSVDAALNNYVAVHYASRHMSWLHCMWGVGASVGPYIMGAALTGGLGWPAGYRIIGLMQLVLTVALVLSLPLWKKKAGDSPESGPRKPLTLPQILRIPGAKEVCVTFFCYCALEQTAILWGSTYLVRHVGLGEELSASLGSLFLVGITLGRAANGFLTYKLSDTALIRLGQLIIAAGILVMVLPFGKLMPMAGLLIIGLGCAPIYPCVIHATPAHFGEDRSQAIIGVQMAAAYVGNLFMPPLFGLIADHITVRLLPLYLGAIIVLMFAMHEQLVKKTKAPGKKLSS